MAQNKVKRCFQVWLSVINLSLHLTSSFMAASLSLRGKMSHRDEVVVTPSLSSIGLKTKQLTEENSDFASRHPHHLSSFIRADEMVQPPLE